MTTNLLRTGSGSINSSLLPSSPIFTVPLRHGSFSGGEKLEFSYSLHLEANKSRRRINRAISAPQAIIRSRSISAGSQTFPEMLPEVEEDEEDVTEGIGSLKFAEKCFGQMNWIPANGISLEESQFTSSGSGSGRDRDCFGSGRSSGGSNNNDSHNERKKIGAQYQKMLKSNPNDPLLLRNYGKFLHEVEGDTVKAEEYYGRAILASPGDGELLSLYGKLIWETQRDGERAQSYFDQAVSVSRDDCMVMGSYAQFMWEVEEDDEEEESESDSKLSVPMVAAF